VQPFCDALHLLEGDRPFLPQVIPIWESLEQHVDAFVAKYPDEVSRVEKYCERFVAPDEIEALREELAMLQLEPLPKQFDSLYKVCSRRTETVDGARTKVVLASGSSRRGCGRATWPRRRATWPASRCSLCAPTACCPCTRPARRLVGVGADLHQVQDDEDDNEIAEIYRTSIPCRTLRVAVLPGGSWVDRGTARRVYGRNIATRDTQQCLRDLEGGGVVDEWFFL
jgi:hypothetical protein